MKVIAAFLLAKLAGNETPTKPDLKKIFESVGAEFDEEKIDLFFSLIKDHDVTELIAVGREKMSSLSSGGAGVATVVGTVTDGPSVTEPAVESKKKVEEEKEESDDESMMNLFD